MTDNSGERPVPPYVSFATLLNQIERMATEGVPDRIDSTFLVGMAGGTQNQFRQALRSLNLIDEGGHATSELRQLVSEPDSRPALIGQILQRQFPELVALPETATKGQLDELLATYDLGTETRRKAATFYVAAASYANLPLSSYIRPKRGSNAGNSAGRRRTAKATTRKVTPAENSGGQTSAGQSHTVSLSTGGTVTLSYDVNLFEVSDADQEFVLGLIKKLRTYTGKSAPTEEDDGG